MLTSDSTSGSSAPQATTVTLSPNSNSSSSKSAVSISAPRRSTRSRTVSISVPYCSTRTRTRCRTVSVSDPCRSTRSSTRIQLKANLSTVQKGNSSIYEYVCKIKGIADALASIHEPVSDRELLSTTLRGLGDGWINLYSAIRHCSTFPSFFELHELLLKSNALTNIQIPSSSLAGSSDCNNGIGGGVSGVACCENDNEAKMLRIGFVKPEIISWAPRIIVLHNFLTSEECDYLIEIARPRLRPSTVQDVTTGKVILSAQRTSFGMSLRKEESKNPIVQAIEKRISAFSQVPVENGEALQVLRYEKNQYYRLHHDYFPDTPQTNLKKTGGQRTATMVMYLNDNVEGGETYFPKAGEGKCSCAGRMLKGSSVKPIKGDAVLFWNMRPDGKVDPNSLHAGCDVLSGEKWSATKWMRQNKYS